MSPNFYLKTWTHIGHKLDSYWTHLLDGIKESRSRYDANTKKIRKRVEGNWKILYLASSSRERATTRELNNNCKDISSLRYVRYDDIRKGYIFKYYLPIGI